MSIKNSHAACSDLLSLFDNTDINHTSDKSLVDLFREQVANTPDAVALIFQKEKLSYKALEERSNQLAFYLCQQGIRKEMLVPICLDRSIEMVIGILAILKAGGAYIPLDPTYPQKRIDFILEDTAANFIITQYSFENFFQKSSHRTVIYLEEVLNDKTILPKKALEIHINPEDLAYVIYTSGTTGKPKGVLVTHLNVVRLFFNDAPLFDFKADDVWTLFHSFCFDFSVWEMYGALLHGGSLVIVTDHCRKNPEAFARLLIDQQITILNQTPANFNFLQAQLLNTEATLKIRYLIFGGAALNPKMLKKWKKEYPSCRLINMYGITETTVHVTYKEVGTKMINANESNIGVPIPGLACLVLDDQQNLVDKGVTGELYIKGSGLARGYLKKPELTNERFVFLDFEGQKKQRYYRSGDLVYINTTNELVYVGRKDDQVKIRGHRIELGEIKFLLDQRLEIQEHVILAKENKEGNKELVVYIIGDEQLSFETIRSYLADHLPIYMVPAFILKIDAIPLTANGKIDEAKLPDPNIDFLTANRKQIIPSSDLENAILKIWCQALDLEEKKVSLDDKFFEIGGNSLKIIKVKALLESQLNLTIDSVLLFQYTTIKSLADFFKKETTSLQTLESEMVDSANLFEDNLNLFKE